MPKSFASLMENAPQVDLGYQKSPGNASDDGMKTMQGMEGMKDMPDMGSSPVPASPASGKSMYTCPMHPEVQQDHPGKCPKCGMILVAEKNGGAP